MRSLVYKNMGGLTFSKNIDGKWGYIPPESESQGADAVIPFNSREFDITVNGGRTGGDKDPKFVYANLSADLIEKVIYSSGSVQSATLAILGADGVQKGEVKIAIGETRTVFDIPGYQKDTNQMLKIYVLTGSTNAYNTKESTFTIVLK